LGAGLSSLNWGKGHVYHSRQGDVKNAFRYPTLFLNFSVKNELELHSILKSRFGRIFSLQAQDYLDGRAGPLEKNVKEFVLEKCGYQAEEVFLQTYPRMFGFVFNPVSFWFFYQNAKLDAVLIEVRNTFGEKHFYWIQISNSDKSDSWYTAEKSFHVSPFLPVEGTYKFKFLNGDQRSRVDIQYFTKLNTLQLTTWIDGFLTPVSDSHLLPLIFQYGWLTFLVVIRIHFQALKLWFKKAHFYSKPPPPIKEVSK
jgi:uncharacterized protein